MYYDFWNVYKILQKRFNKNLFRVDIAIPGETTSIFGI